MTNQTVSTNKLENAAVVLLIVIGIIFTSLVAILCIKLGWPKNATDWFVISAYTFFSVLFFTGAYLGRKISKMP